LGDIVSAFSAIFTSELTEAATVLPAAAAVRAFATSAFNAAGAASGGFAALYFPVIDSGFFVGTLNDDDFGSGFAAGAAGFEGVAVLSTVFACVRTGAACVFPTLIVRLLMGESRT